MFFPVLRKLYFVYQELFFTLPLISFWQKDIFTQNGVFSLSAILEQTIPIAARVRSHDWTAQARMRSPLPG